MVTNTVSPQTACIHGYHIFKEMWTCNMTRRNISKLSTTHRCLFQLVD